MNRTSAVVTLAMTLSATAYAQQTQNLSEFDDVLVTATRIKESTTDTSYSVVVIDDDKLRELQPASVADALKNEANITATKGPRASSQGIEIRGIGGSRVLQIIDGARQNTSSGHRGTYFIDPELLDSIEVVKGPSSSLWGSGAIGGVVALNTKSAKDLLDVGQNSGGYLKQNYETNGDVTKTGGAYYGRTDSFDWLLNGDYTDNNNIESGDGNTLENSASSNSNLLGKLAWEPDSNQRLQLSARYVGDDGRVPSNPSKMAGTSSPLVQRNTKNKNITLGYNLNASDSSIFGLDTTLYWNRTDYDENRVNKGQFDSTEYQTLGFSANNSLKFTRILVTYGVDGYKDTLKTVRDDSNEVGQRPDNIDSKTTVIGAFARSNIDLTKTLSLDPAVRYDHFNNKNNSRNLESVDSQWSPSVGLVWRTTKWLTLSTHYDEAFRAPSIEEMYTTGTHFCMPSSSGGYTCNTFKINPNLKAEKAKNKEVKIAMHFANLGGDDELAISLDGFINDIDDFIEQDVSMTNTSWNNVDKAKITGFEFSGHYRYQQTRLALAYGQTEGKNRRSHQYLADIPADKLGVDLSQFIMQGDIKLGTRFTYVAGQHQVPPPQPPASSSEQYSDYKLWDIYAAWTPTIKGLDGFRFDLAVDNIGNEQYRQTWETLYERGRNVKLSASYRL